MKKLCDNALLCLWRALLFSPVVLLMGGLLPGLDQTSAGLFYAAGQVLALGVSFVPSKVRVPVMIVAGLAYAAAGAWVLGALAAPAAWAVVAFSLVIYAFTSRAQGAGQGYDPRLMIAGALMHVIAPLVIRFSGIDMAQSALMWTGLGYFIMCPFAMNNASVREGMSLRGRGGRPIQRISRANRVMVGVMLAIALIIANAGAIRDAAQRAGEFIMYWVGQLIMWIMNLFAGDETVGGGEGGAPSDMGLGVEATEPSWFALLMEQVMKYFVVVLLAAVTVFVLWKLAKLMRKLAVRISDWAKRFAQGVKEDYLEEREQLMDWGEVRGEMMDAVREALKRFTTREKKWSDMDARERVRYCVRQLYRRRGAGIGGLECLSARQALGEMGISEHDRQALGDIYDEARYSDHEITQAQVDAARDMSK